MEDFKKKNGVDLGDKEIVFSRSIKAGKRIYYLDVKRNRKDELFLAITESKKVVSGEGDSSAVSFEKHKIFLYKEDFEKFMNGLHETIEFITHNQPVTVNTELIKPTLKEENVKPAEILVEEIVNNSLNNEIKIDIDFE
ncbi:MAG: PUR family DNA/RNA-binding protein [Bacteroides sp.]|nr:PUR family DNA/RNA-binding protein [Bacteroides sp.]